MLWDRLNQAAKAAFGRGRRFFCTLRAPLGARWTHVSYYMTPSWIKTRAQRARPCTTARRFLPASGLATSHLIHKHWTKHGASMRSSMDQPGRNLSAPGRNTGRFPRSLCVRHARCVTVSRQHRRTSPSTSAAPSGWSRRGSSPEAP